MSKDVEETDTFSFNEAFTSKFFKVKIGTISAQKESEPEKQETRIKVGWCMICQWQNSLLCCPGMHKRLADRT